MGPAVLLQSYRWLKLIQLFVSIFKLSYWKWLFNFFKDGSWTPETSLPSSVWPSSRTNGRCSAVTRSWTAPLCVRKVSIRARSLPNLRNTCRVIIPSRLRTRQWLVRKEAKPPPQLNRHRFNYTNIEKISKKKKRFGHPWLRKEPIYPIIYFSFDNIVNTKIIKIIKTSIKNNIIFSFHPLIILQNKN